ncbi:hypothetical protein [Bradyrhizobium sp. HKCCYLR20261]|uniref:hypothetical protein n=1 Tax=Bradyrhizobium sp. HKCCYLR20261 TaxID=3420760 RepID=UPI003EBBF65C
MARRNHARFAAPLISLRRGTDEGSPHSPGLRRWAPWFVRIGGAPRSAVSRALEGTSTSTPRSAATRVAEPTHRSSRDCDIIRIYLREQSASTDRSSLRERARISLQPAMHSQRAASCGDLRSSTNDRSGPGGARTLRRNRVGRCFILPEFCISGATLETESLTAHHGDLHSFRLTFFNSDRDTI